MPKNIQERLARFLGKTPDVSGAVFVAANATVVGDVRLGVDGSVFYGAVLRADINSITIGARSNVQDNVVVHLSDDAGVLVGADCTIGHGAILHACTVEDGCLIGMGATVIDGAHIGARSLVGANSLVPHGFKCPPGSLVFGSPAKVVRALSKAEQEGLAKMAAKYIEVAKAHAALGRGVSAPV
ncbi:MAG TPA: gamma carbonic anhydrase family protein [Rariglobus sp.]|jgi:carbonic anhydrase/acetyltransferase-like protein (isoleucine patch superfamily)|nr:gamma carbonic anhydrase family protein [Rariglobus sp.]